MNILLAASKYMPEYSGAGYRAHNLYKRLLAAHPEIKLDIVCGSETENNSRKYEHDGFTVNRIACKQYPSLAAGLLRRWQNICNFHSENSKTADFLDNLEENPDMIHVFGQNYVTVSVIDHAIKRRIPILIELVTDLASPFYYVPFPFKYWISTRPEVGFKFVCISEKLKETCLRHGIREENIWCRPNPVDEKKFKPVSPDEKCELRRKLTRFEINDRLIAYIAKFRPSKNHVFLIDVLKRLPEEYKLFMKGPLVEGGQMVERDREFFDSIRRKAEEQGLAQRIQIESGFCGEVEKYYQMSDVYAFPSTQEGLGTPVLESIACGVPVVANRIPGVTDIWIRDGKNGYLSALEPETFAEHIMETIRLDPGKLSLEAVRIIGCAGTDAINAKYFSHMELLAANRKS